MKKTILLAVAVAGVFTLAVSAQAGEPLLSPRAQDQANSLKKVPEVTGDAKVTTTRIFGSPKGMEVANSLRKVPSTGKDVDLAHAPRPNMAPKDADYETAWRANAGVPQIQIAPLK